jgi:hypothetical protein
MTQEQLVDRFRRQWAAALVAGNLVGLAIARGRLCRMCSGVDCATSRRRSCAPPVVYGRPGASTAVVRPTAGLSELELRFAFGDR